MKRALWEKMGKIGKRRGNIVLVLATRKEEESGKKGNMEGRKEGRGLYDEMTLKRARRKVLLKVITRAKRLFYTAEEKDMLIIFY